MTWIIDAYNVIFACKLLRDSTIQAELNRARFELINQAASWIKLDNKSSVVMVFDAKNPPKGFPDVFHQGQVTVMFAKGYAEADDLIEELIRKHSTPKQLTVVSGDRRIERAAKRRKANSLDSETWYDQITADASKANRQPTDSNLQDKDPGKTEEGPTTEQWLDYFELDQSELADVSDNPNEKVDRRWEEADVRLINIDFGDFSVGANEDFQALFGEDISEDNIKEFENIFTDEMIAEIQSEIEEDLDD